MGSFFYLYGKVETYSPEKLYIIFNIPAALMCIFFSLSPVSFEEYLRLDIKYFENHVIKAAALKCLGDIVFVISSLSIKKGVLLRGLAFPLYINKRSAILRENRIYSISFLFFIAGLVSILILIERIGGLEYFWNNLGIRSEILTGSGYLLQFSEVIIQFSAFLALNIFLSKNQFNSALCTVFLASLPLALLGGRSPIIFIIFMYFVLRFCVYGKFRFDLSKIFFVALVVIVFAIVGNLRNEQFKKDFQFNSFGSFISSF